MLLMVLLASVFSYISVKCSLEYTHEVNQKVNWGLAQNIVDEIKPSFINGEVDQVAVKKIIASAMTINPTIEVYLVSPAGKILSYCTKENKTVEKGEIDIKPVEAFIAGNTKGCVVGTNPKDKERPKVFSAAPVIEDEKTTGYVYVILGSQDQDSLMASMLGSYILKVGARNMVAALIGAVLLGLLAFWLFTKKLNVILESLRRFKEGDLKTRININDNSEMSELASTFNDMAGALEKNIEDLKGVETLRRELIANVSHDLRTPIASIQGYLETLMLKKNGLPDEKRNHYIQVALNNTDRLKRLVNDLFELSKLEAKEGELVLEPMSMGELVHDVLNKYRLIANEKGVHLNTTLSKSLPLVKADIALMDRLLQNIIDNAIKFCDKGDTINIEIENHGAEVEVRIADSGVGISKQQLPYIFDRYQKSKVENYKSGTGLGLAIAKKIVELHNSEIHVESEESVGTTFSFRLPTYRAA